MMRTLRIIIVLIPIVLLALVAWRYLDLDGQYRVTWEPGDENIFVHGFRPTGRVTAVHDRDDGHRVTRLHGDPIYLSVSPPGNYERATLNVWLDPGLQPQVELGATVDADAGQIMLRPLVHQTLEDLEWSSVRQGDIVLWQREDRFGTIASFLESLPPRSEIATYHYTLPAYDRIPASWTSGAGATQGGVSLRGFHEFVAATDGGDLNLRIEYMDMNRNVGADPVHVRVYQGDKLVAEAERPDDGVVRATNASLDRQAIDVRAEGLDAGIVKVELNAGQDVYWRTIESSLSKMTFGPHVTIGDEVGYLAEPRRVVFWTDAQHLTLFTRHAEGVQTVAVGDERVEIAVPHERYEVENKDKGVVRVVVPQGDLVVVSDGHIAFSPDQFFNPDPIKLDDRTDLDALGVNYVIATYPDVQREDGMIMSQTTFPLGNLERETGASDEPGAYASTGSLRFVVSAPRLEDREVFVDIARLEILFERPRRTLDDVIDRILR